MRSSFFSNEDELLLSCCAIEAHPDRIKDILGNPLNWNYIAANAGKHGISSLLYHNLIRLDLTGIVPEKIIRHLKGQYYATLASNMRHYDELHLILISFKEEGIPVVVLKGAALAEIVYKDIGLRRFNDIDILVRKEDLQRAKMVASNAGYTLDNIGSPEAYNEKFGYNLHYLRNIILEIHWDIARRIGSELYTNIVINELWENASPLKLANSEAQMLAPEDMIIHLCIHLAGHRYDRLIWFCDISEIIHKGINWEQVLKKARRYRVETFMYYGLRFASELLDAKVPDGVLQELKPDNLEIRIFSSIPKNILATGNNNILNQINPLIKLLLIDRPVDRIKYLWEFIFPPLESMERRYSTNGKKVYFYYIAHPPYMLIKTGKRFGKVIGKNSMQNK